MLTALTNEIRSFLAEFGIVAAKSLGLLRQALPALLEDAESGLPGNFRVLLAGLSEKLRTLDDRITASDTKIAQADREDDRIKLMLEKKELARLQPVHWLQQ